MSLLSRRSPASASSSAPAANAPRVLAVSSALVLTLGAASAFAFGGCSSSSDAGTPAAPDAGEDAAVATLTYSPAGCAYDVTPPATRGYEDLALDDETAAPGDASPLRVRIGLGGRTTLGEKGYADPSTSAVLTWETVAKTRAAKVRMGVAPDALTDVHAGYTWSTPAPLIGFGANEPPAHMHEVHVCGLEPATTYYYQVGGGAPGAEAWSATQSFTTVPRAADKVTVGVFGDSRDRVTTWQAVHQRMRDAAVSLSVITGDVVDFGTQHSAFATWLDAIWKDPSDPQRFLTLGQQMQVTIAGNHEHDSSQFYGNFSLPGDGALAEQYASFDVGSAHVALVDDEPIAILPSGATARTIVAWLEADLAKADAARDRHPFLIVASHRALFSSSRHAADSDVLTARAALAPLMDRYHVDLVLNGHEHEYERSKPLRAAADPKTPPTVQPEGQGTVYVVNAGAGADAYPTVIDPVYREKTAGFGGATGYLGCYGVLTLEAKKLTLDAYMLKPGAGPDDLVDTLTLTK